MGLVDHAILFASSFFNVFLLGFQSKNVQHSRYLAAALTSVGITVAQYFFARYAAHGKGAEFLLVSGTAGASGIVTAIAVHNWLFKRRTT